MQEYPTVDIKNPKEVLLAFMQDEDAFLINPVPPKSVFAKRLGEFWVGHHYLIHAAITKAVKHLNTEQKQRVYFHYLRKSGGIPAVADSELEHLVAGYRQLLPSLDIFTVLPNFFYSVADLAQRHHLLFVFGFDETGVLPSGMATNAAELKQYVKCLTQIQNYSSLPAMRRKLDKFKPFTPQGERAYQTLRHLDYRHDRRHEGLSVTDLAFWGMVLLILLTKSRRCDLLKDLLGERYPLVKKEEYLRLLNDSVQAVLPECEPDEEEFFRLAQQLAAIETVRRRATESCDWAQNLELALEVDEDWQISIRIPETDNSTNTAYPIDYLTLKINSYGFEWHIAFSRHGRRFSEWAGRVTQDDVGLEGLGKGQLLAFPVWLKTVENKLDLSFNLEAADIGCEAKRPVSERRSVEKIVSAWLHAQKSHSP